jgi:hypothetical protein
MSKIKFIMDTDWVIQEPIDFEHKQYVLLGYLKKIDALINEHKLYPTFIEISLHLANLHAIMHEHMMVYTDKKFKSYDDEVILQDLSFKELPEFNEVEQIEIINSVKFSTMKIYEYFEIVRHYWSYIYDNIELIPKRNKNNIKNYNFGVIVYVDETDNNVYIWEYLITKNVFTIAENNTDLNLIFSGDSKSYDLDYHISNSTKLITKNKRKAPVFFVKIPQSFPIEETLAPLFKRKVMSYIMQSVKINEIKKLT